MFVKDNEFTFLGWMLLLVGALAFIIAVIKLVAIVAVIAIVGLVALFLLAKLLSFLTKLLPSPPQSSEKLKDVENTGSGQ